MSDLYRDEIEKIKYYRAKITDRYLSQGIGINKEQVQKELDKLDLKIAIFSQAYIRSGETLSVKKFNEQKQDIYNDLAVLYKVLFDLVRKRVEKAQVRARYELDDLRLKTDRFKYLTEAQTVAVYGTTVFHQTNNFDQKYEDGKVYIDLGPVTVGSGCYLVPILDCGEIDPRDVTFQFDNNTAAGAYNYSREYLRYTGDYVLEANEYQNSEKLFGKDLIDIPGTVQASDPYNLFLNRSCVRIEDLQNNTVRYAVKNPEIYVSVSGYTEVSFYVYGASYIRIGVMGALSYKNYTGDEILSPAQRQKIVMRGDTFSFDIQTDGILYAEKVPTTVQDDKLKIHRNYTDITDYMVEHISYGEDKTFENVRVIINNATHTFYDINYIVIKQARISELEDVS